MYVHVRQDFKRGSTLENALGGPGLLCMSPIQKKVRWKERLRDGKVCCLSQEFLRVQLHPCQYSFPPASVSHWCIVKSRGVFL